MEVICINNKPIDGLQNMNLNLLEEGNVYNVVSTTLSPTGKTGYILSGIKTDNPYGYDITRFIPTSPIDETEMERDYKTKTETI